MNGGSAARCARIPTTRGISRPAHIRPRCRTPAICSRSVRLIFIRALQIAPIDTEHRQNDVWTNGGGNSQNAGPAATTTVNSQPRQPRPSPSRRPESRALARDSQSLEHEVSGGQSVATARGYRDHQLVNQARDRERPAARRPSGRQRPQRPEGESASPARGTPCSIVVPRIRPARSSASGCA